MNHAEYTKIPGLNWSSLKHLVESPRLFQLRLTEPEADSAVFLFGRALHCQVLEPERFGSAYAPMPAFGDLRFKENKEAKAKWEADKRPGVEYLSAAEWEAIGQMHSALLAHRVARELLTGVRFEELVTWTDKATGLLCKSRQDCIGPRRIVDLKSARRVGRRYLGDAADYLYHGQLAFYHDGAIASGALPPDADRPVLIAALKEAPWDVQCLQMTEATLEAGRALYRSCLRRFQECEAADVWPGVAPDLQDWDLPAWAATGEPEPDGEQEVSF